MFVYDFRFFSRLFGIAYNSPELVRAQYQAMARQTWLLNLTLVVATLIVGVLFLPVAPASETLFFPAILLAGDALFLFWFVRVPAHLDHEEENRAILARLHATVWSVLLLGPGYFLWIMTLFGHGDVALHGELIAIAVVVSLVSALCLMHVRASVLSLMLSGHVPLIIFLWNVEGGAYRTSAVVFALASLTFTGVLVSYGRDFARMVRRKTIIDAERVKAENLSRTNRKLANEDSLTGLANRRHFFNLFEEAERNMELGQLDGLFVGILGLDGFRSVNDVYGHRLGDDVLGVVGQRLRDVMCRGVLIARLGGDQFGILVRSEQKLVVLQELGNRICEAIKAPMEVNGIRVEISGSVGLAKWEGVQDTSQSLFEKADFALCRAKKEARGSAVIFNASHAAMMRERSGVDRLMREGAFEEELFLVFQPLVCTKEGKTVGFEVLARWISSEMGFISPDIFIASAERNGMINRVTAVLLEKALQEAKAWPEDVFMSFNLSAHDIMSGTAILNLISIVRSSGFDPRRITFEVTETAIMENFEQGMQSLTLLKNLGCRIALDDFGTGYSSLAYVRSLPLDKLKLDRSFITDIETDEGACAIVHTMVEMCQSLELECVIEGVETRGQLGILNAMGGHIIQGYFFSRPLKAKQALAYLREERSVKLAS